MASMSKHFSELELMCRCGCGLCEIDLRLLKGLETYRELTGKPCHVTSACRCEAHNRTVGGSPTSQHLASPEHGGMAADIHTDGLSVAQMALAAEQVLEIREGGLGLYTQNGFIHIDVRPKRKRWSYINGQYLIGLGPGIRWPGDDE